jgi:hypothetical protein
MLKGGGLLYNHPARDELLKMNLSVWACVTSTTLQLPRNSMLNILCEIICVIPVKDTVLLFKALQLISHRRLKNTDMDLNMVIYLNNIFVMSFNTLVLGDTLARPLPQ